MKGMATMVAATRSSLVAVGLFAARTEKAASPTPSRTRAQEPDCTTDAVIKTRAAVIVPPTAIAPRATFPTGWVTHAGR